MSDIYVDQKFIGTTKNSAEFLERVVHERRMGKLPMEVNVGYDDVLDMIFIETSAGRLRRPLLIVKDGKILLNERHVQQLQKGELTWYDLVKQGIIEYVDATEEELSLIAFTQEELTPEHSHMEIAPMGIVGLAASLVPFGNHNYQKPKAGSWFLHSKLLHKNGYGYQLTVLPTNPSCKNHYARLIQLR
jgi:DNA-directed RNA polymerase subunit B'